MTQETQRSMLLKENNQLLLGAVMLATLAKALVIEFIYFSLSLYHYLSFKQGKLTSGLLAG